MSPSACAILARCDGDVCKAITYCYAMIHSPQLAEEYYGYINELLGHEPEATSLFEQQDSVGLFE